MGEKLRYLATIGGGCIILILITAAVTSSQSQALDGQIEGSVTDQNGAAVASARISVTNIGTGAIRNMLSDSVGIFRVPLLPLGTYRLIAEAPNYKKVVREGVTLVTGQTATVDITLTPGEPRETVIVVADAPVADAGKTDLGRVMNAREVHNIPLPTRNPYNFIILQAGVTGRPNRGFNYPQINVNGFARRVNYLLDGNTNTRGDQAGARLLSISETYLNEMQLLAPSFAAEFGDTTGLIVNMVTPAGTNDLHGSALYFFRRPWFYARPFAFPARDLPDNVTSNLAGHIGGPIRKDRWHFYLGYEYVRRDDSSRSNRQVTISAANRTALIDAGLPASVFVPAIPSQEHGSHFIFRTDAQLDSRNRLTGRFNLSDLGTRNNIQGGFNTLERSYDIGALDHSLGVQLASFTDRILNELRFQFVRSDATNARNAFSGTGPSVTITNAANFGSPIDGGRNAVAVIQLQNNLTVMLRSHAVKFGGGISVKDNLNRSAVFSMYSFPSISAYIAARNGVDPSDRFNYSRYEESFGDPEIRHRSTFLNFFVQDDWKATGRLKLNIGLRYDLYVVPRADASASFAASRKFNTDKNNIAPRFGLVYALRDGNRPLVLRAGAGLYFEPPWTDMYTRALRDNGDPAFFTRRFCGNGGGPACPRNPLAPAFPDTFSGSLPQDAGLPQQDIVTVAPDFENMYAIHSNIQFEQALTADLSFAVGYLHSGGRHIPVYRSINAIAPVRFLADGRPVFGPARFDPRFNIIQMAESVGVSQYDALTLQLTQRYSRGIQFSVSYTLSRAVDDAPEQNVTYSDGNRFLRSLSDPTNRSLDKGYAYGDQRHTFVMSVVASPRFEIRNRTVRSLLNHNRFGVITTANSGERFSVRTAGDLDLNGDGLFFPDRPVGFKRNAGKTPPQFNTDLRYSRIFSFTERYRLEAIFEIQNIFNVKSIVAYNNVSVTTDPSTGQMVGPLPDFKALGSSLYQESRQFQIGAKFLF
jgi:hypothetical protein